MTLTSRFSPQPCATPPPLAFRNSTLRGSQGPGAKCLTVGSNLMESGCPVDPKPHDKPDARDRKWVTPTGESQVERPRTQYSRLFVPKLREVDLLREVG